MNAIRITFEIEDETGRQAEVRFSSQRFATETKGALYPSEVALVAAVVDLVKRSNHFPANAPQKTNSPGGSRGSE